MQKFITLIEKLKTYNIHSMYSIKSITKTKKVYKYDGSQNIDTTFVLNQLIDKLWIYSELEVLPYDVEFYNKECIEYISTDNLTWSDIENSINDLGVINNNAIKPSEINDNCDLDIFKLEFEDGKKAYIVNKHSSLSNAFKNRIWFSHTKKLDVNSILSFNEYADVIIYDGNCYILHEDKFNSIFKYREKLDTEVQKGKEEIESWQFLDNAANFYEECNKNYNTKRAIVKAVNKKGLNYLESATPEQIMNKIKKHEELYSLKFDANNKIIVTPDSTKIILKILTNKIGLDLFTESIFGTGDNENEVS